MAADMNPDCYGFVPHASVGSHKVSGNESAERSSTVNLLNYSALLLLLFSTSTVTFINFPQVKISNYMWPVFL